MVYSSRHQTVAQELAAALQVDRRFVTLRIVLFLIAVLLACICLGDTGVAWPWVLVPLGLLLALLPLHNRILKRQTRLERLSDFFRMCLDRSQHQWTERPVDGSEFAADHHPWSQDLDLFGRGSLFQMLCECRTGPGRQRLAEWMTTVPTAETIRVRQERTAILRQRLDLRESLASISHDQEWNDSEALLRNWAGEPAVLVPRWIVAASLLIGVATLPVVVLISTDQLPVSALLLLAVLQAPLIGLTRTQIRRTAAAMDAVDSALLQLAEVIRVFESEPFRQDSLLELQRGLATEHGTASREIAGLSRLTRWLNQSLRNQFFSPIAWMGGLLVLLTARMELWRQRSGRHVADWIRTCAEFEATVSMAAWNFEHPEFAVPELTADRCFDAEQLGHPLISSKVRVVNDVVLTAQAPLILISGSNMSGKSTLLRSVGCNLVLMHCGGVVVASRLRSCPFRIGTAMRVSDSLQDGRSLFMNVVDRLRMVVELTRGDQPVLFLLDEILQGTNSYDRRLGAEAVIRMLIDRGALGMVTTHDLALTRIVETLEGRAMNQHFEDTVVDDRMTFDYRLKPGVVTRSNALHLMRLMGLDVADAVSDVESAEDQHDAPSQQKPPAKSADSAG